LNRHALATSLALTALALGTLSPSGDGRSSAALAQSAPSPTESAIIEIQEGPATSTPSPSPSPTPATHKNGRSKATAAPGDVLATETPTPEPVATEATAAAIITPSPLPVPLSTPRPLNRPLPLILRQPTIPQSLEDPDVSGVLHRSISLLSTFNWMMGTWNAHNVEEMGDGRQRDLGTNTYVFAQTMKGRWIFGADGKATDYFYISYDPFAEHWILVRMNSNPSYGLWISERGWHGNTIEFTSTYAYALGRPYQRRTTLVRKDAKSFGIYDEEQLPDGSWTSDDSVELTKQAETPVPVETPTKRPNPTSVPNLLKKQP
jgi:hypothetical protein